MNFKIHIKSNMISYGYMIKTEEAISIFSTHYNISKANFIKLAFEMNKVKKPDHFTDNHINYLWKFGIEYFVVNKYFCVKIIPLTEFSFIGYPTKVYNNEEIKKDWDKTHSYAKKYGFNPQNCIFWQSDMLINYP